MTRSKTTVNQIQTLAHELYEEFWELALEEELLERGIDINKEMSKSNEEIDEDLRKMGVTPEDVDKLIKKVDAIVCGSSTGVASQESELRELVLCESKGIWEIPKNVAQLCMEAAAKGGRVLLQNLNPTIVQMEPLLGETTLSSSEWKEVTFPLTNFIDPPILDEKFGWMDQSYKIDIVYQHDPISRKLRAKASVQRNRNNQQKPRSRYNSLLVGISCGDQLSTGKLTVKSPTAYLTLEEIADERATEVILLPIEPESTS